MIRIITNPITIDKEVSFVPEPPHYFTINRDPLHGGLICSYSGYFKKEGETPMYDDAINESLLSNNPCYKLLPVYFHLKEQRDKNQNL